MYETGVLVALLIRIYTTFMLVADLNSVRNRNFKRIGMRVSWLTGEWKPMVAADYMPSTGWVIFKALAIGLFSFSQIIFSWLHVGYWFCLLMWGLHKRSGMPNSAKELGWKMKNQELTKEQIIEAIAKFGELTPAKTDELRREVEDRLSLDPNYTPDSKTHVA